MLAGTFAYPWTRPYSTSMKLMLEGYDSGMCTGHLESGLIVSATRMIAAMPNQTRKYLTLSLFPTTVNCGVCHPSMHRWKKIEHYRRGL